MRSLSTSPLVTRSPTRVASSNSASTAPAKCEPKTSAVVVPARARPSTKSAATPAAYVASARRASSGSAQRSSQSSSGMPRPPIARTCGKCTWVSTNPGSTSPSRRSTTSSSACSASSGPDGPRATMTPSRTTMRGVGLGAQVVALEGALRGVEEGAAEDRHRRCLVSAAPSRSNAASSSAATATAIAAGSLLVVTPGRPIGRADPVDRCRVVTVGEQLRPEPRQLGRRPDQADRAEVVEPDRGVAQRDVLGVVVGHHQQVGAGRQLGEDELGQHRDRVHVHGGDASASGASASADRCSARESTRCRSRSWRARMRASSRPTWPTPKIATLGTTGSGSSRTATSPPQHCTPCCSGALSERWLSNDSGLRSLASSSARAPAYGLGLEVAAADRAPGTARGDDHLRARLARGVAADVGHRDEYAGLAGGAEVGHRLPPRRHTRTPERTRSSAQ